MVLEYLTITSSVCQCPLRPAAYDVQLDFQLLWISQRRSVALLEASRSPWSSIDVVVLRIRALMWENKRRRWWKFRTRCHPRTGTHMVPCGPQADVTVTRILPAWLDTTVTYSHYRDVIFRTLLPVDWTIRVAEWEALGAPSFLCKIQECTVREYKGCNSSPSPYK